MRLNEDTAQKVDIPCRLTKLPNAMSFRGRMIEAVEGFARALISTEGDTVLEITLTGPYGGQCMPVVQLVMAAVLSYTEIADMVITYPTLNEGLVSLFDECATAEVDFQTSCQHDFSISRYF